MKVRRWGQLFSFALSFVQAMSNFIRRPLILRLQTCVSQEHLTRGSRYFSTLLRASFATLSRVSAILKEDAPKVREGTHNKCLSREVSHSSCTLLGIWLKPCCPSLKR